MSVLPVSILPPTGPDSASLRAWLQGRLLNACLPPPPAQLPALSSPRGTSLSAGLFTSLTAGIGRAWLITVPEAPSLWGIWEEHGIWEGTAFSLPRLFVRTMGVADDNSSLGGSLSTFTSINSLDLCGKGQGG